MYKKVIFKSIINFDSSIIIVVSESTVANNNSTRDSKIKCEVCGLLFDSLAAKEEHTKLEHIEHKRPSGVG